jgi:hypothetical protein
MFLNIFQRCPDDYVGMKIGETTKAKGFDPGSPYLMP